MIEMAAGDTTVGSPHSETNKSEQFNGFAKKLFFGGEGEIAENLRHEQRKVIKYNHLFCGEDYLQHDPPVDASSLCRWRRRMGEEGVEWLLTGTIEAARQAQLIKARSAEKLIVDTTVMEKAISYPTDSKLLECARRQVVGADRW
jgi:hypothetical protein